MKRRMVMSIILISFMVIASSNTAFADYPNRPIKFIVPWTPGGQNDLTARIISDGMRELLSHQFVVTNIEGAAGALGRREVKKSKADGYTVGIFHSDVFISHHIGKDDANWYDYDPVARICTSEAFFIPGPDTPWMNLDQLVKAMKEKTETVTWGMSIGSWAQFACLAFMDAAGVKASKIIPTGGESDRIKKLLTKEINMNMLTLAASEPYIKSKQFRALGIMSDQRNKNFPDVPTVKEQGYNMSMPSDLVMYAPKGLPKDVLTKLQDSIGRVLKDPKIVAAFEKINLPISFMAGDALKEYLAKMDTQSKDLAVKFDLKNK